MILLKSGKTENAYINVISPGERQFWKKREHIDYFMESASVRYLRTSCWRIRKRTSERSKRVSFLIQKQRVRKYRTKHFPCCKLFILYLLGFFNLNQFSPFIRQNKYRISYVFIPSKCKYVASS